MSRASAVLSIKRRAITAEGSITGTPLKLSTGNASGSSVQPKTTHRAPLSISSRGCLCHEIAHPRAHGRARLEAVYLVVNGRMDLALSKVVQIEHAKALGTQHPPVHVATDGAGRAEHAHVRAGCTHSATAAAGFSSLCPSRNSVRSLMRPGMETNTTSR